MQETTNSLFKPSIALLLAALMLMMFCFPSTFSYASTYQERTIRVLIVYDETYEQQLISKSITSTPAHRIEQMARLAAIPLKKTWNISLDISTATYEQTFGEEPYVNSCPYVHKITYQSHDGDVITEDWYSNKACECFANNTCRANHHTNADRLVYEAHDLAQSLDNYDFVCIMNGHVSCFYRDGYHRSCAGMSIMRGNGFIVSGIYGFHNGEDNYYSNIMDMRNTFIHELSHCYDLDDGYFYAGVCDNNYPCVMSKTISGVVYAENVWCLSCLAKFTYDRFGTIDE